MRLLYSVEQRNLRKDLSLIGLWKNWGRLKGFGEGLGVVNKSI